MSTAILPVTASFEPIDCCSCGLRFWVPAYWKSERKGDKKLFYCPNGHSQSYCQSEADILRHQLATEQRRLAITQDELAAGYLATAKLERKLKRIKNGVCPCCKRSFPQLQQHMRDKHTDFLQAALPHKVQKQIAEKSA